MLYCVPIPENGNKPFGYKLYPGMILLLKIEMQAPNHQE
jgi:hypothetical protein